MIILRFTNYQKARIKAPWQRLPIALQSSTNFLNVEALKKSWVMMKSAPASTYNHYLVKSAKYQPNNITLFSKISRVSA